MKLRLTFFFLAAVLLLSACQGTTPAANTPDVPPAATAPVQPADPGAGQGSYPAPTAANPAEPAYPAQATAALPPAGGPIILTDGLGRTVQLETPAQRIVSLAPSNTEILYALGAGSQLIGRDDLSDFPPEAKALPSIGGWMGKFNYEVIASLKPDLVLASGLNTADQVKALEDLGLTVFYVGNPADLEGMYTNLQDTARLAGKENEASSLIASLKTRVAAVEERIATVQTRPTVFYELDASDPAKPYTTGPGTFLDALITMAGGQNVAADLGTAWAQISQEDLLVKNPEVILLGDAAYGVNPESLAERPGWEAISAVKNGKIYTFDDNLVSRPTPRLVDGLETLARLVHPEAFQ